MQGDAVSDSVWGTLTTGPVPAPHSDCQVVVQAVLDGTPRDLFDMLLADNSHMLEDFLDTQGNRSGGPGGAGGWASCACAFAA